VTDETNSTKVIDDITRHLYVVNQIIKQLNQLQEKSIKFISIIKYTSQMVHQHSLSHHQIWQVP
jgi:hypothetical protein